VKLVAYAPMDGDVSHGRTGILADGAIHPIPDSGPDVAQLIGRDLDALAPEDKALVQTVAHDIRATIQENLWDMLGKRRSVWFG